MMASYTRPRAERELAGWQCLAGRALLHMDRKELARLVPISDLTLYRFETEAFRPRVDTVLKIERALRAKGVIPTWDRRGEPKGVNINWLAYARAYPGRRPVTHRRPEELAADYRAHPEKVHPIPQNLTPLPREAWPEHLRLLPPAEGWENPAKPVTSPPALSVVASQPTAPSPRRTAVAAAPPLKWVGQGPPPGAGIAALEAKAAQLLKELARLKAAQKKEERAW